MKIYIIVSLLMICVSISTKGQLTISSPIDRAVYQRNASGDSSVGSATITLSGQGANVPCVPNSSIRYRIYRIGLTNGTPISTLPSYSNFSVDARGRFFTTTTLGTGWYQVDFQLLLNNNPAATYNYKIGVGDVYIIAGQSNAQGLTYNDAKTQQPSTPQTNDVTHEALVSCNYDEYCLMQNGKMPKFPVFSTLASGTSATSLGNGNAIGPTGHSNWCYTVLGNQIASQGIPVAFFNTAAQGSSIQNWEESSRGLTPTTVFDASLTFCNYDVGTSGPYQGSVGEPYATFKKTLKYFGSLFGIRAVLWHQGESDNFGSSLGHSNGASGTGLTASEYETNLANIIEQSRRDFGDGTATGKVNVP